MSSQLVWSLELLGLYDRIGMAETSRPAAAALQQHTLRHSLTVPAGFHASQKRYSTPSTRLNKDELRSLGASEVPVPLMKAISSVPHEGLSARNPVWMQVQAALIAAFKGRANQNLGHTARLVRMLAKTVSPGVVLDYLEKSLLKKGFKIVTRRLDRSSEDPEELLESLESVWRFFHSQLVTELKCILQPMGADLQLLDRALMLGFRDQVLLPTGIHSVLRSEAACGRIGSLSPDFTRMLLVLQMHRDSEPPSENDVSLERMVALVVRPYIGFLGVYNGAEEPELRANLPELVKTRRRLTRRAFVSRSTVFRRTSGAGGNGSGGSGLGGSSDSSASVESASLTASAAADAEGITIVMADESDYSDGDDADEDAQDAEAEADNERESSVRTGRAETPTLEATAEASEEDEDEEDEDAEDDEEADASIAAPIRGRFSSEPNAESSGAVIFV